MISRFLKVSTIAMVVIATTTTISSVSSMLLLKPDQQSHDDHNPIVSTSVVRFAAPTTPCETTADCPPMTPCTFETAATNKSFLRFGGSRTLSSVDMSSPCGVQLVCIDNYCSQEQLPANAHVRSFGGSMDDSPLIDPMPLDDNHTFVQIGTTMGGECSETVSCPLLDCDSEPCPEIKCIAGICSVCDDTNVATTTFDLPVVQASPFHKVSTSMILSATGAGAAVQPQRRKGSKRPVVQARVSRPPKNVGTKGSKQPKRIRSTPTKRPTRVAQPKKNRPKSPVAAPKRKTIFVATTP